MATAPSASFETLRRRAAMLAAIRGFFAERGVLEVETPALLATGVSDPAIESARATVRSVRPEPMYLQTSPEFPMKRLLAAGSGDIFQICRVFRDAELGRWHQPEFTLLEWYRVGFDDVRLMDEVEALLAAALAAGRDDFRATTVARRLTYADALRGALGVPLDAPTVEIAARLAAAGIDVPAGLAHDAVLDLALSTLVVPGFAPEVFTFVHDYPASQAALARLKPGTPPIAARFEVFGGGLELANGFHELTDATEQRRRFEAERAARRAAGRPAPPVDETLLDALAAGLPDCAGVAVGVDRLVALATGARELASVVTFAHSREG
jgi:elongation factor P--(R)-beta-lysine ligase